MLGAMEGLGQLPVTSGLKFSAAIYEKIRYVGSISVFLRIDPTP